MDWFNRKRVKFLEDKNEDLRVRSLRAEAVVKFLIEEPDSNISTELKRILSEIYNKSMWNKLTRENHLGYIYNKENTEAIAKELTKYF